MIESSVNWCERCRVAAAVLQLSADTCTPCSGSVLTDENGSCGPIIIVP
jgi:hypothetical protein